MTMDRVADVVVVAAATMPMMTPTMTLVVEVAGAVATMVRKTSVTIVVDATEMTNVAAIVTAMMIADVTVTVTVIATGIATADAVGTKRGSA
jgi:hypothetical protein